MELHASTAEQHAESERILPRVLAIPQDNDVPSDVYYSSSTATSTNADDHEDS